MLATGWHWTFHRHLPHGNAVLQCFLSRHLLPSLGLQLMPLPDSSSHLEEKQAKPLIMPAGLADTVFPLSDCV